MAISDKDVEKAEQRMRDRIQSAPTARSAHYDRRIGRVVVALSNGLELAIPPKLIEGLTGASPAELSDIKVSVTGMGLHFPILDADIYLPALLEGVLGSPRWMAALMGKAGGEAKSEAKGAASRRNGRLGGRPRKAVSA